MFISYSNEDIEDSFGGFEFSKEKQLIQELIVYVQDVSNPGDKELTSGISDDVLTERMDVADNVPTFHHDTDSEIVDIVKSLERNVCTGSDEDKSNNENGGEVRDNLYWQVSYTDN